MAINVNFGYQNEGTTVAERVSTVTKSGVDIGLTTNYALTADEPDECQIKNVTSPVDQGETITYQCRNISNVATSLENLYPAKVTTGVQYVVKIEDLISVTSDTDPEFRVDLPIVASLQIRHPKSGYISDEVVTTIVNRLLSASMKNDGTWRFDDLMRSALKPTEA